MYVIFHKRIFAEVSWYVLLQWVDLEDIASNFELCALNVMETRACIGGQTIYSEKPLLQGNSTSI